MYLYAKDPFEAKYKFLINKRKITGLNHLMTVKLLFKTRMIWMKFIKWFYTIQIRNVKHLIAFDDMIADMHDN